MKDSHITRGGIRRLTVCALLVALSILFTHVFTVSTGFLRFNLGCLPVLLAAILFGPGAGFAVGAVADMIGGVLAGYAINPLITLGAASIGLAAGLVWKYLPARNLTLRLSCGALAGHLVGSVAINSLALHLFYNYPWSVLAARIPNTLAVTVAEVLLLRVLLANRALMQAAQGGFTGRRAS